MVATLLLELALALLDMELMKLLRVGATLVQQARPSVHTIVTSPTLLIREFNQSLRR